MSLTDKEYEFYKERLEKGRVVVEIKGRTASNVAELDFIRAAKDAAPSFEAVTQIDHTIKPQSSEGDSAAELLSEVGAVSQPFTPDYVAQTSPTFGDSATALTSGAEPDKGELTSDAGSDPASADSTGASKGTDFDTNNLKSLTMQQLRLLPESEQIPQGLSKPEHIAAIQSIRDAKAAETAG